jgi:hypothetical protein
LRVAARRWRAVERFRRLGRVRFCALSGDDGGARVVIWRHFVLPESCDRLGAVAERGDAGASSMTTNRR